MSAAFIDRKCAGRLLLGGQMGSPEGMYLVVASFIRTLLGLLGALMWPGSAHAADLGGNCCADLEERVAELEATTARKGNRKISLTITGWVPAAIGIERRYIVIDPTSFALEDNALRFIGAGISNVLGGAMNGSLASAPFVPSSPPPAGQMNLGALPAETVKTENGPPGPHLATSGVWASALGGYALSDSDALSESDNAYGGGIGGARMRLAPNLLVGAFAGGATNRLETDRGKRIDTDYILGGLYGRAVSGPLFLDATLTAGHSESSSARGIVSTVAGVPTFQTARADYDSTYLLPLLRFGAHIPVGDGTVFVPAAQARYHWQRFDGYEESGSAANLAIGERDVESFEERIELGIEQTIGLNSGEVLKLHGNVGGFLYHRTGDREVDVGVFTSPVSFDPGGDDLEAGLFVRAGFALGLTPGVDLFADGEFLRGDEVQSVSGSAGLRAKF